MFGEFRQAWLALDRFAVRVRSRNFGVADLPFCRSLLDFISPGSDIGPHLGPICSRSIGGFPSSLLGRPSPLDSRRLCQLRGARITTR
jgi:hypothetical protein